MLALLDRSAAQHSSQWVHPRVFRSGKGFKIVLAREWYLPCTRDLGGWFNILGSFEVKEGALRAGRYMP